MSWELVMTKSVFNRSLTLLIQIFALLLACSLGAQDQGKEDEVPQKKLKFLRILISLITKRLSPSNKQHLTIVLDRVFSISLLILYSLLNVFLIYKAVVPSKY